MEYRKLGESGLRVSALSLGAMMFGDRTDETEAKRITAAAAEAGVNFIDTADRYAKGESERITGKARYFGISNYRGWRLSLVMQRCKELGVPKPVVCQPSYNAMNRQAEVEVLPACHYFGSGIAPYSPPARGVLTGKYKPGQEPPADTRAGRKDVRMLQTEFRQESLVAAQEIVSHAAKKGMSGAQFAINWVLNKSLVSSAITGPRTLEQWKEYEACLKFKLDGEDEALIDRLVPPGHPSSPGYSDPRYPFAGRIVRNA